MLVATRNPCPCGYAGDPSGMCTCANPQVLRYQRKISGPLMDRIDLVIEVPRVSQIELTNPAPAEPTCSVAQRVAAARQRQRQRYTESDGPLNCHLSPAGLAQHCQLDAATATLAREAVQKLNLSARAYNRILKVTRTIADLEGSVSISAAHFTEALLYRPRL